MMPENLPQKDSVPEHNDQRRIEEIAQIVLQVVESGKGLEGERKARFTRTLNFLSSNWAIVAFLLSTGIVLISWFAFGISPFYEQQKLAQEQARLARVNSLADQHVELGTMFLNAGELVPAKAEFERALELEPGKEPAIRGLFKIEVFSDIQAPPVNVQAPLEETELVARQPEVVQKRLVLLFKEYPNDTHIWTFRGILFSYYDQEAALESYQRAVEINPNNAYAYALMTTIYFDQGKYDKSLETAEKAHNAAPWDTFIQQNYASALYAKGRYQDAIAQYEYLTTDLDPLYIWAYHDLAQLYRLTGELDAAQAKYEEFIKKLEDKEVMSLERNQGPAAFIAGPDSSPVYLAEDPEKRYYTYYSTALTAYLRGHREEAESYMSKAQAIPIDPFVESEVKRLMEYDIHLLQEKQEDFRDKAEDFQAKFL